MTIEGMEETTMITKKQLENPLVYQANAFIQSCYKMTLNEKRILNVFITQLRRDKTNDPSNILMLDLNMFNDFYGLENTHANIDKAARSLTGKKLRFLNDYIDEKGVNWLDEEIVMVTRAKYGKGFIKLKFSEDLMPLLEGFSKGNFTPYALKDTIKLTSIYSIRFYELFRQKLDLKKREFSLDKIRDMFGLHDKYPNRQDLYRRVIKSSIDDINENTDMRVSCSPIKEGRKIVGYSFTFRIKAEEEAKKLEGFATRIEKALGKGQKIVIDGNTISGIVREEEDFFVISRGEKMSLIDLAMSSNFKYVLVDRDGKALPTGKEWARKRAIGLDAPDAPIQGGRRGRSPLDDGMDWASHLDKFKEGEK